MTRRLSKREILRRRLRALASRTLGRDITAARFAARFALALQPSIRTSSGHTMYLNKRDHRAAYLWQRGGVVLHDSLDTWTHLIASDKWDVVIDVGANYGEMLANVALPDNATVIALEPNVMLIPPLTRTLSAGRQPAVALPVAASDNNGVVRLYVDREWSGNSTVQGERASAKDGALTLLALRLDELLSERWLDVTTKDKNVLVKVDAEGHDHAVIRGCSGINATAARLVALVEATLLSQSEITALAEDYALKLYSRSRRQLVDYDGLSPIRTFAERNACYHRDLVLVGPKPV